jgi:hypothetical protein
MLYVLWMIVMVCGFYLPIFGCHEPVDIKAYIDWSSLKLHYVTQKDIEKCNAYNMDAQNNSPCFVNCHYGTKDSRIVINDATIKMQLNLSTIDEDVNNFKEKNKNELKIREIFNDLNDRKYYRSIPFSCFIKNSNSDFKEVGEELFSFQREVCEKIVTFRVKLGVKLSDYNAMDFIKRFKEEPLCALVDKVELIKTGIIINNNGVIQHGSKGYFKENEIEEEQRFFNLRNVFCISIPLVVLYAMYKFFTMK